MLIATKSLAPRQEGQLSLLLERKIDLKELILKETPAGLHYIFAYHQGKTQHFYISDNAGAEHCSFICESIWKAIKPA